MNLIPAITIETRRNQYCQQLVSNQTLRINQLPKLSFSLSTQLRIGEFHSNGMNIH